MRKYILQLEERELIVTRSSGRRNGNLLFTLRPIQEVIDEHYAHQLEELGWKASEGCVRMDYRTDETYTINAYWIWTHLERGTKVLVLDDPEAREARMEALNR